MPGREVKPETARAMTCVPLPRCELCLSPALSARPLCGPCAVDHAAAEYEAKEVTRDDILAERVLA